MVLQMEQVLSARASTRNLPDQTVAQGLNIIYFLRGLGKLEEA
jgi:hypothetical protein